ncbi:hypothetical protein ONS95_008735 [Cadophora gregata]|uniref:uncharacterized protein n=1 Tax=Cadophora gregata TaxID=51156 RepID=UPI0026DD0ED5|nr:uncharacterized protein ONS95_008735 [Cadophora gregata]KAK0123727.1 hypothetical protein ONS95_008735 [Cadophora gregata]KAK0130069.1 hypothetical protein ONS96_000606 [Cadophora gregata f. sp. sojae]
MASTSPSNPEIEIEPPYRCANLFTPPQIQAILTFLNSQPSPHVRISCKNFLKLLNTVSNDPKTQPYTNLKHKLENAKDSQTSERYDEEDEADKGEFVAPTGREASLADHFRVKDEMQGWSSWKFGEMDVKRDFGRVYVHFLKVHNLVHGWEVTGGEIGQGYVIGEKMEEAEEETGEKSGRRWWEGLRR